MTIDTSAAQAAMVSKETSINTAVTAVIAAALSCVIFRGHSSIVALSPPVGGILGILPGTFNFTLLVTLALTLITRRRVRSGSCPPLARGVRRGIGGALPANLIGRAIVLAAVATLVFVTLGAGGVWLATRLSALPIEWSFLSMLGFYVVYFVFLSLVVTPIILWRALAD